MLHLSYHFCAAWLLHAGEPVAEIAAAAIGGAPDPAELMEAAEPAPRLRVAPGEPATPGALLPGRDASRG
jgi:hypothetical protein